MKADNKVMKLLVQLAEKLGADVAKLSTSDLEDFNFVKMLDASKKGKLSISKEALASIDRGLADLKSGKTVPHEEVMELFKKYVQN